MPAARKHITAVLEPNDEALDFIRGGKTRKPPSHPATQPPQRKLSIRLPVALDDVLAKVRHERSRARRRGELPAGHPHEKQEILAEALQEWLEKRGYLAS